MIICASRRTDIPAFHSEWLMNRLRAGYCLARNPVSRNVVHRIDLRPENVDMLVLMTKDPQPMIQHLDEIQGMGINFCFQVTVTPYGRDIEPRLPGKEGIIDSFRRISERIGKERIIWRYDPIILNGGMDEAYHVEGFGRIAGELEGYTERCIIGSIDIYGKLERLREQGMLRNIRTEEMRHIAKMISGISEHHGIGMSHCSAKADLSDAGISNSACISSSYMRSMNIPFEMPHVPIRQGCGCVKNTDIGDYDTCSHDCIYCYANKADRQIRSMKTYDPDSEMLSGGLRDGDTVVRSSSRQARRITDF